MAIDGSMLINAQARRGQGAHFTATEAATGQPIAAPVFASALPQDVNDAAEAARAAFDPFQAISLEARAALLDDMAQRIDALGGELTERAMAETGLPAARLEGERARTVGQLRMFAHHVRAGDWLDARIEPALPERQPPRRRLALQRVGLGPVAVFGASNFPLAFSVAGGDTAAALAAGCPVVVKAHPSHPGTSELVGRAVMAAVAAAGLPPGVFSLLVESGQQMGVALVQHPAIQAVGFTGSRQAGQALMRVAAARPQPIPVYAEMSSINPTLLLPAALAARPDTLARDFVASLTLGSGQFCTNPGLLLALEGPGLDAFVDAATVAISGAPAGVMLNPQIAAAYERGAAREREVPGAQLLAQGQAAPERSRAALLRHSAAGLRASGHLPEEVFGPFGVLVVCADADEMIALLEDLEGQLTATLHLDDADLPLARRLLPLLQRKVGRILANAFPTGVEVCDAMVHGGPYPATSDGRSTSVGTAAIERFLRPVCYDGLPDALLPAALQQANPLGLRRRVASRFSDAAA